MTAPAVRMGSHNRQRRTVAESPDHPLHCGRHELAVFAKQPAVRTEEQNRAVTGAHVRARSPPSQRSFPVPRRPRRAAQFADRAPRLPRRDKSETLHARPRRARRSPGRSRVPFGYPTMNASGKTITFAPVAAASPIRRTALSTQASVSNGTARRLYSRQPEPLSLS